MDNIIADVEGIVHTEFSESAKFLLQSDCPAPTAVQQINTKVVLESCIYTIYRFTSNNNVELPVTI